MKSLNEQTDSARSDRRSAPKGRSKTDDSKPTKRGPTAKKQRAPSGARKYTSAMPNPTLPKVNSNTLSTLRHTVEDISALRELVGPIAQFHIVVDANILIREILWIAKDRRNPSAISSLRECILAETIVAYVTSRVVDEVEEHLPVISKRKRLDLEACLLEWANFKALLQIQDPDQNITKKYHGGRDPDDAPTLALADALGALGILTADNDIRAMGGTCIPIQFVLEARNYSRQAALNITIQVGGYYVAIGTWHVFRGAVSAIKYSAAWFRSLPAKAKILVLLAAILLFSYPKSRGMIIAAVKAVARTISIETAGHIVQGAVFFAELVTSNPATPPSLSEREQQ